METTVTVKGGYPAVNVKVRDFGPSLAQIAATFECSEEQAQKARLWRWL